MEIQAAGDSHECLNVLEASPLQGPTWNDVKCARLSPSMTSSIYFFLFAFFEPTARPALDLAFLAFRPDAFFADFLTFFADLPAFFFAAALATDLAAFLTGVGMRLATAFLAF